MKGFIAIMLLAASVWGGEAGSTHILVVDRDGNPVDNVSMILSGYQILDSPAIRRREKNRVLVQTDRAGRVEIKLGTDGACGLDNVRDIWKGGYKFEKFLNASWNSVATSQHTLQNPRRYVLRKLEDEKAIMLNPLAYRSQNGWHGGFRFEFSKKNRRTRCDVDLFKKQSGAQPDRRHLRYTDFSVEPHFDSASKSWSFTLMTTNSGSGIIATTNRVLKAPENGYAQRIDVPPEFYNHPAFTIYLRTRTPRVYSMIAFDKGDYFGINGEVIYDSPSFTFAFRNLLINPTGGTTFEEDESLDEGGTSISVADSIRADALDDLFFKHRYPRRPHVQARIENRNEYRRLYQEEMKLIEKIDGMTANIKKQEAELSNKPDLQINNETKSLKEELRRAEERCRVINGEYIRLDKELHTLFHESK